jgi:hypothetical protein
MNRSLVLAVLSAFALIAGGCNGAPQVSPDAGSPGAGQSPVANADPLSQLCDPREPASLAAVATQLERPDDQTNVTELSNVLATTRANLEAVEVDDAVEQARQAAVTAIQQLQDAINDPEARAPLRTQTAVALRTIDSAACTTESPASS